MKTKKLKINIEIDYTEAELLFDLVGGSKLPPGLIEAMQGFYQTKGEYSLTLTFKDRLQLKEHHDEKEIKS